MANTRYETPNALRHDAATLVEDARELLNATTNIADEKVAAARKQLETTLASGRKAFYRAQDRAKEGLHATDECVREHPYYSAGIALAVGLLIGFLATRHSSDS